MPAGRGSGGSWPWMQLLGRRRAGPGLEDGQGPFQEESTPLARPGVSSPPPPAAGRAGPGGRDGGCRAGQGLRGSGRGSRQVTVRQLERPPPARPGPIRPPVRELVDPAVIPEAGVGGGEELGPLQVGPRARPREVGDVVGDLQVDHGPQGQRSRDRRRCRRAGARWSRFQPRHLGVVGPASGPAEPVPRRRRPPRPPSARHLLFEDVEVRGGDARPGGGHSPGPGGRPLEEGDLPVEPGRVAGPVRARRPGP